MLYILVFLDVASLTRNDDDDALRLQDDSGLYVASHGASGYDGRACPEVAPREAVVALAVVEEDGAVEMVVSIKAVVEMAIWKWGNVSPRPKSSKTMSGGGRGDWVRGQAMPPQKQWQQQGNNKATTTRATVMEDEVAMGADHSPCMMALWYPWSRQKIIGVPKRIPYPWLWQKNWSRRF